MVSGPAPHQPVGTCSAHSPQAILEGKVVTPKSRRRFGPERGEDIAWLRGFASSSGDFVGYSVLLDVTAVPATFDVWKFLLTDRQNMRTGVLGLSNGSGADLVQGRRWSPFENF